MAKKIFANLINTISIIIIVFSLLVLIAVITTKAGKAPNIFGFSMFKVATGSMEPTIKVDSLILTKKTPAEDIKLEDVITFYSSDPGLAGAANTHRVVEILHENDKYVFRTKGDANNREDDYPVDYSEVIGRVVWSSYTGGKIVSIFSNPIVFIPLVIVPLGIIIVMNIVSTAKTAKLIAKEEEAAVREAIAEIRAKNNQK